MGNLEGAKQSFDRSMEIDRNFGETHGGLAVVAVLQNRMADAEQAIKRAMRLNPHSYAGLFAQSLITQKTDPEKAKQIIAQIFSKPLAGRSEPIAQTLRQALQRYPKKPKPGKNTH